MRTVTLVGFGAIGRALVQRLRGHTVLRVGAVVVPPGSVARVQAELGNAVRVCSEVPADTTLLLECAGHAALLAHVLPALGRGVQCAVLSVGALSEPGLAEQSQTGRWRATIVLVNVAVVLAGVIVWWISRRRSA